MPLIDLLVPSVGESVTEVTLLKWIKLDGEIVSLDQPLCEFESDKATFELPAQASGRLIQLAKEGDDLKIGDIVGQIDTAFTKETSAEAVANKFESKEEDIASVKESKEKQKTEKVQSKSEPIEKDLAENRIELNQIESGKRTVRRQKMSRMRKTISKRLVSVKNETAMLTTFNEVDMTAIIELRKNYNEFYLDKYGVKIGFMSLFAKACAKVLMEMPEVNAYIDGEEIVFPNYVDISIAISKPNGLVVPPIFDVQEISVVGFENKLKELAEKARNGKLSLDEMTGGTFTITNGGVFGSLMSTPILNEPQSAILGMHAIKERPIAVGGQIVIRPMMYLALSYDHRIIDGSTSVTFLVKVIEILEDPLRLFV